MRLTRLVQSTAVVGVVLALGAAPGPAPAGASASSVASSDVLGPGDVLRDVAVLSGTTSVSSVMRDGERVVAVLRVDGVRRVLERDVSRDDVWQPVPGEETTSSAASVSIEAAAHGVTVIRRVDGDGSVDEIVTGSSGHWTVPESRVSLDAAGGYVLVQDGPARGVYTVDHVRVAGLASTETDYAVDRGMLWTLEDRQISRTDLARPDDPAVAVATAPWCARPADHFAVRGRWASMTCLDGYGSQARAVDLDNRLKPAVAPTPSDDPQVWLADGAFASGSVDAAVTETGAQGPIRRMAVALDTVRPNGSGPGFSYLDPAHTIHLLDPALTDSADADATAPTVSLSPVPTVIPAGRVALQWAGTDPAGPEGPAAGIAYYQISYGTSRSAPEPNISPRPGQTTWSTDLDGTVLEPCFRVRAVDRRANIGAWSDPACTRVDAAPPDVTPTGYPITLRHASGTDADVDFRFRRTPEPLDPGLFLETRLRRSTQSSTTYGDWSTPYPSITPLRTKTLHAGQRICFQGRGVDSVGNRSEWLPASCTAAPYDDSLARRSGSTSVFHSVAAFGGSARTLTGSGSLSVSSYSSANCVSVRALGGPLHTVGDLDVFIGGRHAGTIRPWFSTRAWGNAFDVLRPMCGKGTVTVRHHAGTPPVTVDWIALTRPGDDGYEYGAR